MSGTTRIDTRSDVHPGAQFGEGVQIGPYAVVGADVSIGSGTVVKAHAIIEGKTTIGRDNRIFQFASVGTEPQDLKYRGEDSELIIGDKNIIRECATVHRGTEGGGMITRIGNGTLVMAYVHVAHDCQIGDRVIMANQATLGGHVVIGDDAVLGGMSGVHQFCRVGAFAMVGGGSIVVKDVTPYATVQGDRARMVGLNLIGMKRKGLAAEVIAAIKSAYSVIFHSNLRIEEAIEKVRNEIPNIPEVKDLVDFLTASERGIVR